jgi:hypothetical protein
MPYPYGTKGAQGGRQIAPGLPVPACMSLIDNTSITNVSSLSSFLPVLNSNFEQTSDWRDCTGAVSSAFSISNTEARSLHSGYSASLDGFPISDTKFVTLTSSMNGNFSLFASVFDISSNTTPAMVGDTLLAITSTSNFPSATIAPSGRPSLFLSITRATNASDAVTATVFEVLSNGAITTASTGTYTGTLGNNGSATTTWGGIYIKAIPLGSFGIYEHWLVTSGTSATVQRISYNTVTRAITISDNGSNYLGVILPYKASNTEVIITGYAHPCIGGNLNSTSPYRSEATKRTYKMQFSATDGAFLSTTLIVDNSGLNYKLPSSINLAAQSYPNYFGFGKLFGNYPSVLLGASQVNSDLRDYDLRADSVLSVASGTTVAWIETTGDKRTTVSDTDIAQGYFRPQHTITLSQNSFARMNGGSNSNELNSGFQSVRIHRKDRIINEMISSIDIAAPSGFDLSSALSNKIIAFKDKIIWLNKTYNNTTAQIKLCYIYPK